MHFLSQALETGKRLGALTSANEIAAQAISEIMEYTIAVLLEIHTYERRETKKTKSTNQPAGTYSRYIRVTNTELQSCEFLLLLIREQLSWNKMPVHIF